MSDHQIPASIRAAIMNQRIYPVGSPIVEKSVSQVYNAITSSLESEPKVSLSVNQGKLFVRGQEISDGSGLVGFLQEHEIQSVTFTREINQSEIGQLVVLLSQKKSADLNVADWLKEKGVTHIQLDKVRVLEVLESDMAKKKLDHLFDSAKDFPTLVGSMRDAYGMMDQLPDEKSKREVQDHLARQLASLEPSVLRDMFDNALPKKMEDSGIRDSVVNAMTQDKIHEIFSEIGNWYQEIKAQGQSEFEVVDQLNKLKGFLGKLLRAPASKEVPFGLYEELLNQGLLDEIPEDIQKKPEDESLVHKVDALLEQPDASLVEPPIRDQLPSLVQKLHDVGLEDLAQKLGEKLLKNLDASAPLVRQSAVRLCPTLLNSFSLNRKKTLVDAMLARLEKLAEQERNADVYKETAEVLGRWAAHCVVNKNYGEATSLVALLRRHQHDPESLTPRRQENAGKILEELVARNRDLLVEDLASEDAARKEAAQDFLVHLGQSAVPCFLGVVKRADSIRDRRMAAEILKYYGAAAQKKIAEEINPGNPSDVLLHLFSILDDFLSVDLIPRLEPFVHSSDSAVRRAIVHLLVKLPPDAAGSLLTRFLNDADEGVQIEAIRSVGEMKNREAVPFLMDLLKSGSTKRLEEVCLALGHIKDDRGVPALSELIHPKSGGLFRKKSDMGETVRVRATWALTQMDSSKAREVLMACLKDPNLQIQAIAKQSLGQG